MPDLPWMKIIVVFLVALALVMMKRRRTKPTNTKRIAEHRLAAHYLEQQESFEFYKDTIFVSWLCCPNKAENIGMIKGYSFDELVIIFTFLMHSVFKVCSRL